MSVNPNPAGFQSSGDFINLSRVQGIRSHGLIKSRDAADLIRFHVEFFGGNPSSEYGSEYSWPLDEYERFLGALVMYWSGL